MLDVLPPAYPAYSRRIGISHHQQLYFKLRDGGMLTEV
jgi:hypothetical protein